MEIFDKQGKLIIPKPDRLQQLGHRIGVQGRQKKIRIKELYCEQGHPLITADNPTFDSESGIHLICEGETFWQSVYLSPFQNDSRKHFKNDFHPGEILKVLCPVCYSPFPQYAPHDCQAGAMYIALFLGKDANLLNTVCVCNVWGCYSSFLRLSGEILSEVRIQTFPL